MPDATMSTPNPIPRSDRAAVALRSLTRDLAQGKEAAWRQFFDLYHQRLRAYLGVCWRGERDVIDDLLQDTLLRAVKHIRIFDDEAALWSWLTVLARSAVNDHGRKRSRFRGLLDRVRGQTATPPSRAPEQRLEQALAQLAPEDRDLIQRKYEEGESVREIAAALGTSEKAIESRLTRCRQRLHKHITRIRS